jgi:hypothetical protein
MKRTGYWCIFAIVSISLPLMTIFSHSSYAVPPSACDNRVDAKIISLKIKSKGKTIDVLSKHGAIIDASIKRGYSVQISLSTDSTGSGHGRGTLWLTTTAYGFSSGSCVNNVHYSEGLSTKKVSVKRIQMGQASEDFVQDVKWGSWPDTEQANYQIRWH